MKVSNFEDQLNQEIMQDALKAFKPIIDNKLSTCIDIVARNPNEDKEMQQMLSNLSFEDKYLMFKELTMFIKLSLDAYSGDEQAKKQYDEIKKGLSQYKRTCESEDYS